jgi:hypothetical protein
MALLRRNIDAKAIAFAWTRIIEIAQLQWVPKTSMAMPRGEIRNLQYRELSIPQMVTELSPPDYKRPTTRWVQKSYTQYTYEVLEWCKGRTVTASGADQDDVHWPDCTLASGEEPWGKDENYSVTFATPTKQYETTLDEAQWRTLTLGTTYRLSISRLGRVREVTPI